MTSVSVRICSYGAVEWADLAWSRAYPSAAPQAEEYECFVCHLNDGTLAESRNYAATEAEGEWLVFLDADDELAPGYVAALRAHLEIDPSPLQLLVPQVSYVEYGRTSAPKYWHHGQSDLRDGNWMVIGTAVHRSVFEIAGGFKEWTAWEDWDLWQRCVLAGAVPVKVPGMVYVAHVSNDSRNLLPRSDALRLQREIVAANYGAPAETA